MAASSTSIAEGRFVAAIVVAENSMRVVVVEDEKAMEVDLVGRVAYN